MTEQQTDGVAQVGIIWPWTWYGVMAQIVEEDVSSVEIAILALIFWKKGPKYGPHPADIDITERHLEGTTN